MTVLVDDWRPKHSLADDPAFLASLEGLDEGLETEAPDQWPPVTPQPAAEAEQAPPGAPSRAPVAPAPPSPPISTRAPRATAPPPQPAPPVASPRVAEERPSPDAKPQRRRSVLELFPPKPPAAASPAQSDQPQAARRAATPTRPAPPAAPPVAPPPPAAIVPTRAAVSAPRTEEAPAAPAEPKPYLTFYGLDEDPFALTPDPRFFYHATSHDDASQELLTAIRRREGVVVVTGPAGVGKTTLCRTVIEHLDRRTLTSYVATAPQTFDDLATKALVDFGVISREELERRQPPADELLVALREFLLSLAPLQAFGVLFVDDAQRLPTSVLREVARLAETGGEERLLQIVLVGNERLERKLRRRELRALAARVSVRCDIEPLEPTEVPSYVVHRLVSAGPNPRADFSDAAFARIHELSRGLPALVNHLCDRALEIGAASAESVIERETIDEAAKALGVEPPDTSAAIFLDALVPGLLVVVFLMAGAAAAAYVFQDRVSSAVTHWEQIPHVPTRPSLPRPPALAPVPPPQ